MTTEPDDPQNGYIIFQIEITDRDRYMTEYIPTALETVEEHGGRVLVGADAPEVVEGQWGYNWTVVLEFPTVEDANAWYESEAYESVQPVRHESSDDENVVIVPGFAPE
jgi:uncharacterized protein (DUF1330 family)